MEPAIQAQGVAVGTAGHYRLGWFGGVLPIARHWGTVGASVAGSGADLVARADFAEHLLKHAPSRPCAPGERCLCRSRRYSRAMPESEKTPQLLSVRGAVELTERLMQCESIRQLHDDPKDPEAAAIADALGDLEKVFRKYLDELLPKVLAASTCEALEAALTDLRLEFQEVVWHLWYPKYFRFPLLGRDCHPDWIDTSLRP